MWFLGPFFAWLVGKLIIRRFEAWNEAASEAAAARTLPQLHKMLENPPSLLESVAYIVCFLPIPIALTMMVGALLFWPGHRQSLLINQELALRLWWIFLYALFLFNYLLFSVLAFRGISVAYRLRHGEARYAENYKAGIQKRIDRLKKKYPRL